MISINGATPYAQANSASATKHQTMQEQLASLAKAEYNLETMTEKEIAELKEVCAGIEQIFAKLLTDQMRKSVQRTPSESSAQNQGHDIFEEMLYDEYGKKLSTSGALGIADIIFREKTTPLIRPADVAKIYKS
jgi:Rod binding domain-containing protein